MEQLSMLRLIRYKYVPLHLEQLKCRALTTKCCGQAIEQRVSHLLETLSIKQYQVLLKKSLGFLTAREELVFPQLVWRKRLRKG